MIKLIAIDLVVPYSMLFPQANRQALSYAKSRVRWCSVPADLTLP